MSKRNLILFLNHEPGYEVLKHVSATDNVLRIYVDDVESEFKQKIVAYARDCNIQYFNAGAIKDPMHVAELKALDTDFIICVYWPYLLQKEIFSLAKLGRVNFHPALLPINRGWFPHVHSIIDGSPAGVTLHEIEEGADTGGIWVQEEVQILPYDTGDSIYLRLQKKIVEMFKTHWHEIKTLQISLKPQDERIASYHKKNELAQLDIINMDEQMSARDLINRLRARTFGNKGFAYFLHEGERIYLNLRLSNTHNFSE